MQQLQQFFSNLLTGHMDPQSWATLVGALIPLVCGAVLACIKFAHSKLYHTFKNRRAKKLHSKEQRALQLQAEQHIEHYRSSVPHNPKIVQVQILDMDHPLNLVDLYVPMRVYPKSSLRYAIDPIVSQTEEALDPNVVLQAARKSLELRMAGALDPHEAIRQCRRCVIVGNPGVGKTTLLRYIAIQAANKKLIDLPTIPIYVELSNFQPGIHKDLFGLIMTQLGEGSDTPELRICLQDQMHAGNVLLLLDGLDETRFSLSDNDAAQAHTSLVEAIMKLSNIYRNMPIVVTVRKAGYLHQQPLHGFHTFEVVDFQPEDSQVFVANWFNATGSIDKEEKIRDLNAHLDRNLRMLALASNPLLLSLIVIVYEGHLNLPERRAELYSQCVEVLQNKWDARRNLRHHQALPPDSQLLLLQEIAWYFHVRGKHYFSRKTLLQVITSFLPSVAIEADQSTVILNEITRANGLLQEQAYGWYGFSHLTFQEYFVMLYVKAHQELAYVLKRLNNPWWEEVLLLYAGSISDASSLLKTLLNPGVQNDLFETDLIIAGRCLGERPVIRDTALRKEITDRLFHVLETTPYALLREQAANALVAVGNHYINGRLMQMLDAENTNLLPIQESVIQAFGRLGGRALARELTHLLTNKQVGRYLRILTTRAICTMSALGESHVAQTLSAILMDEQDDIYVRQSIALTISALGTQNNQSVIAELVAILERKCDHALVQQSVVQALSALGAREVVPKLQAMLIDEQLDWHVRGSIAKVLGVLGDERIVPTLLKVLANNTDNTYVRRRIAISIGCLNPEIVPIERLLEYVAGGVLDVKVCCSIARVLGVVGRPDVIPRLIELLREQRTNSLVKASLAIALGMLGRSDQQVVSTLNRLRRDPQCDLNLKGSVLSALAMLGYYTVFPDLLALMREPQLNQDVLLDIIHAIGYLGDRDNLDREDIAYQLARLLADEQLDRFRGQNIARVVGALGERNVVPELLNLLENRSIDRYTRQDIADTIGQLAQDEESAMKLSELLSTTDIVDEIYHALWKVSRQVNSRKGILASGEIT